ncbi:MAG: hypothetical protein AB1487_08975 [Thermodesulfobacteriota bacterium]
MTCLFKFGILAATGTGDLMANRIVAPDLTRLEVARHPHSYLCPVRVL